MNVAIIIGVPVSVVIYFMSNRLLPVTMINRAEWEIHSLFITLFICILFCLFRPIKKLWQNMLWLAASVCILLPTLNAITTEHNILSSIQKNDWLMLGFDLSMLFFAVCFAISAIVIKNKMDDCLMSELN